MYIINENEREYRFGDSGPKYLMKGPRMNFAIVQFMPGQDFTAHYHNVMEENFFILEGKIDIIRQTAGTGTVDPGKGNLPQHLFHKILPHLNFLFGPLFHLIHGKLNRFSKAHNAWNIFRSRPASALLGSAVDKGTDLYAISDIQKADSLGAVYLVAAGAEHVDVVLVR